MSQLNVNTIGARTGNNITLASGDNFYIPGHILQVVQGTYATETATTSSSYVDTGLSVNITPSATSSKILVITTHHTHFNRSFDYGGGYIKVLRDSTSIDEIREWMQVGTGSYVAVGRTVVSTVLDSPSTTSQITYKSQFKVHYAANSESFKVAYDSANQDVVDTLTVLEVGG